MSRCPSLNLESVAISDGHVAESVLIGERLVHALLQSPGCNFTGSAGCHFPQQIDPFTAVPYPGDCYGPMILSLSEHVALRMGIAVRPEPEQLWWTGKQPLSSRLSLQSLNKLLHSGPQ